ncbi:post-transcriptional regulator [Halobacillus kuroshimensis]|uniref:Post-transcriptional regulator n=1 Tax=Halobacillus kuroshimensis TaxID=302481 RepID=A0ABS3DZL1_9BACI|nr:post-transcriptional regulator [Halobacillus kuroshimensis]MBN8236747.1 post-transcriptional regulator [Halobacillus kuroshimensis]
MEPYKRVGLWKKEVAPVTKSKAEEFRLLGYPRATQAEIWNCLMSKVWKGEPEMRLHQVVQDIFHLSSHTYTSYLTVEAYQNDDLLASIEALNQTESE